VTSLVVATVLSLAFAGVAHAFTVEIVMPTTDPLIIAADRPQAFEAVAYDDQQQDITAQVTWSWDFDDGSGADTDNPTEHAFETAGTYTVTVTATFSAQQQQQQIGVDAREPTGDFVLARSTPNGYVTLQGTEVCHTRYLIAFDKFARGYDGVRFRSKRAEELEFGEGTLVYQSQQIVLDGQQPRQGWMLEWTTSEAPGQAVVGEPNGAVDWQIIGKFLDGLPPDDVEAYELIGEPTYTIKNTVVSSPAGVLLFDPDDEELDSCEISWTTTHQNAFNVKFVVPIYIYDLDGNELYTHTETNVPLGNGSWTWHGEIVPQEPEGPEQASKGVYTYRLGVVGASGTCGGVRCVCTGEPSCARGDWDKSAFLEISNVHLGEWTFDSRNLQVSGEISYTLSREAGTARLRVFDPGLGLVGSASIPSAAGAHTFEFQFPVQADSVSPYWFVIDALESGTDGAQNRDRAQKPALERGGPLCLPIYAYNFRGALFASVNPVMYGAAAQQGHAPEGVFYPAPAYNPTCHPYNYDVRTSYERLADHDYNWHDNPVADAVIFYIGHGDPGVLLVGDQYLDAKREIWTGQGTDDDMWHCLYMGNERFGANAFRRARVTLIAACYSADDRPAGMQNGPRDSVMDACAAQGAGAAIGYHGWLSESVAQAFCTNFWWMACAQCDRYGNPRQTTIQQAFSDAAELSGMPMNWECIGSATGERVRPAHYRGRTP